MYKATSRILSISTKKKEQADGGKNGTIFILSQQDTPGNMVMIAIPFIYRPLYGCGERLYATLGTYQKYLAITTTVYRIVESTKLTCTSDDDPIIFPDKPNGLVPGYTLPLHL